ncbi:MAG: hypothetical protein ACRBCS_10120 [Cellvibrionaceae bacterium]
MHKGLGLILLLLLSSLCNASNEDISLSCSLSTKNYPSFTDNLLFKDVTLNGQKHTTTGSSLVFSLSGYEFWAMNHAIQTTDDKKTVLNFQVAIKNITTKEFTHALSNGAYSEEVMFAQISLVQYAEDRLWEVGELIFKCMKEF